MKSKKNILLFSVGFFIGLLVLIGAKAKPAQADSTRQDVHCGAILEDAAQLAGIDSMEVEWISDGTDPWGCEVRYCSECNGIRSEGMDIYFKIDKVDDFQPFECFAGTTATESSRCDLTTFHGYPARLYYASVNFRPGNRFDWYVEQDGAGYVFHVEKDTMFSNPGNTVAELDEVLPLAEALWSAAEGKLPGSEVPPAGQEQSNSDCAGVTPDDLRSGGLTTLKCRLHCDPNIMSDDELWTCINQFSGQPGITGDNPQDPEEMIPPEDQPEVDIPTSPDDQTYSDQPKSLGPLASSPLVPLAGGLIGTAAGWLLSLLGNRAIAGISKPGSISTSSDSQEKFWSERPWDEAGPGYVTKEEYERTKHFIEQGYKWTNGGWQTPDQIKESDQWQQKDKAAVTREDAASRLKEEQDLIRATRQNPAEEVIVESPAQNPPEESNFGFDPSGEVVLTGDQGSSKMAPGAGIKVNLYKNQYYDAKDVLGDIQVAGVDLGNWKADGQFGKVQSGAGFGYDQESGKYSAGGFVEGSTYQLTGEGVVGNKYAGVTADAQIDGPKGEAFIGYKDGSMGASIGGSIVSGETGIGMNVANYNVGVRGGLSFGLELGVKVGADTEIKLGPFKLGLSFGAAKTGL